MVFKTFSDVFWEQISKPQASHPAFEQGSTACVVLLVEGEESSCVWRACFGDRTSQSHLATTEYPTLPATEFRVQLPN